MTGKNGRKKRVLVVEDESLIAFEIEHALETLGCEVVGPVGSVQGALEIMSRNGVDGAVLDVTVRDGKIFPVAEQLQARNIPFVFASGYADWSMPEVLRKHPRLTKPFTSKELAEQLRLLTAQIAAHTRH